MFCILFIMLKVKFVVLLICVVSCSCISKYCKICLDHVLCKYPTPGPSGSCKEYHKNTFLTAEDINDLVNQINERRNFIAMGHSKRLPRAANMKKVVREMFRMRRSLLLWAIQAETGIHKDSVIKEYFIMPSNVYIVAHISMAVGWSEELATFAQRWVDQCDPSEKEDQCRDLEYKKVGQNIASIINPSLGFNVKSFIEMWFMQSLEYAGSVSYYQLQDQSSKYFTQLIWAETDSVGCGRAKFAVNNAIMEKIVCNFSPKGNVYGKPVYAIGFPGTQCANGMAPDRTFSGLCTHQPELTKLTSANVPVSSLLRILNLSNDSVKQEIDPLYNNIKQINHNLKEMEGPRHQMMRHILRNKIQSRKSDGPYQEHNFWENPTNISKSFIDYDRERGHSRLYHNHAFKFNDQPTRSNFMVYDNKYPLEISRINFNSEDNYRKNYPIKKCTRSTESQENDCNHSATFAASQNSYKCTRGLVTSCKRVTQGSNTMPILFDNHVVPQELCPCSTHKTTYPTTITKNQPNLNCECENGVTIHCPNLNRKVGDSEGNQKKSLDIYDHLYPNPNEDNNWFLKIGRKNKPYSKRSQSAHSNRKVKKREFSVISTLKPFWQIDGFNNDRDTKLKALKYTTLPRKKGRKDKKHRFKSFRTESITIESKKSKFNRVTEKYLSFDELLHLRKYNSNGYGGRRQNKPDDATKETGTETTADTVETKTKEEMTESTETTEATELSETTELIETTNTNIERKPDKIEEPTSEEITPEFTANTPFIRMKHCTRKLTCTWTATSLTDNEGSIIPGAGGHHGSRTPPGYVEGCTRTSTCTRDYMDRNIFPTFTTESSVATGDEDESDYCERRSLNVRKRSYHRKKRFILFDHKNKNKDSPIIKKRNDLDIPHCRNHIERKYSADISYGDLFYLVLHKIIEKWKNNRFTNSPCRCSKAITGRKLCLNLLCYLVFVFNL